MLGFGQRWKFKVNIKKYLSDDETLEALEVAKAGVCQELRTPGLREAIEAWRRPRLDEILKEMEKVETVDEFNDVLVGLYDWADCARV